MVQEHRAWAPAPVVKIIIKIMVPFMDPALPWAPYRTLPEVEEGTQEVQVLEVEAYLVLVAFKGD